MATVMVVEKEANSRLLMEFELADAGHHGVVVAEFQEADEAMQFEHPDCVVLGIGAHSGDECRILYWFKCRFPEIPVILYVVGVDPKLRIVSRMADALVVKRSNTEPLLEAIARLTRRQPVSIF